MSYVRNIIRYSADTVSNIITLGRYSITGRPSFWQHLDQKRIKRFEEEKEKDRIWRKDLVQKIMSGEIEVANEEDFP